MALPSNETHNTKRRKEPYHEQGQTHRGLRRSRIRRSCAGRTRRMYGWRGDRPSPPPPPPPPRLADASATTPASALVDSAASAPASAATPAKTRLSLVGKRNASRRRRAHRRRRFHRLALARLLAEVAEWRMSAEFAKNYIWNVSVNASETPLVQKPSPTLMFTSLA